MKLYAICVAKNEGDIIAQCLLHALTFCDRLFIIDNDSSDNTWETVKELAQQYPQIVPFLQTSEPFRDSIRSLVYNQYHQELSDQDWWLRLDADEFLVENPRSILEAANQEKADFIQVWQAQFYYTDVDYKNWQEEKENFSLSIMERRRYYAVDWREYRLFRNQTHQPWNEATAPEWPNGLKKVFSQRILNRHYQFRDPEQIEKRLQQRYAHPQFKHVTSTDWKSEIRSAKNLDYYQQGYPFKIKFFNFYLRRIIIEVLNHL